MGFGSPLRGILEVCLALSKRKGTQITYLYFYCDMTPSYSFVWGLDPLCPVVLRNGLPLYITVTRIKQLEEQVKRQFLSLGRIGLDKRLKNCHPAHCLQCVGPSSAPI